MKKAFTLIELLVVIAIIAILAAILFPVFAQAKAAAKAAANLSNVKQVSLGVLQYMGDSDDVFPLAVRIESNANQQAAFGVTPVTTTTPAGAIPWSTAIYPYTKSRDILVSPLASPATGSGMSKAFAQSNYYGVVPTAAAISAATGIAAPFILTNPYGSAKVDGLFGYAVDGSGAISSVSQTSVENLADKVMLSDAGAYDMGFLAPTFANGSATAPATFAAYTPSTWLGTVWTGPWGRKNSSGSWNTGQVPTYTAGQRGQATFASVDGSARSQDISKIYEVRSIDGTTTNTAFYKLYQGATQ